MSLNETLAALGYTTRPAVQYQKHIIDADGVIVFTGAAYQVWAWLRETDQIDEGFKPR